MVTCQNPTCVLIPSATVGPYYFDVNQVRTDTTEGRPGTPMDLVDVDTCAPIPDAIVDIWHCGTGGLYSGYNQPGGNTVGQDLMRDIQFSDSNGEVTFRIVFPW